MAGRLPAVPTSTPNPSPSTVPLGSPANPWLRYESYTQTLQALNLPPPTYERALLAVLRALDL